MYRFITHSLEQIQSMWTMDKCWEPKMDQVDREKFWKGWKKAVTKSFGWASDENEEKRGELRPNYFDLAVALIGSLIVGFFCGARYSRK